MSDEEYDYMSDNIIAQCKEDVRPGLINNRAKQRAIDISKKQAEEKLKNKPLKVIESERRNEGLSCALDAENKGFALLQKMGYKPGQGIGKVNSGRIEPVEINLKSNREGLGRKTPSKLKAESSEKNLTNESVLGYRQLKSKTAESRRDLIDYLRCQRACHTLDVVKKKEAPDEKWYWPQVEVDKLEEKMSDDEVEAEEEEDMKEKLELEASHHLELLTKYLRETHQYCHWCGTSFDDERDMKEYCPGPSRDDH